MWVAFPFLWRWATEEKRAVGQEVSRPTPIPALGWALGPGENPIHRGGWLFWCRGLQEPLACGPHAACLQGPSLAHREALRGQLLPAEQDEDTEGMCKPLSCGWEITDTLCVGPVFTPASIM